MKNGESPKKTAARGSAVKPNGSAKTIAGPAGTTSEAPKKRFGLKAKAPLPAPRQPRPRQRLSVTVLGMPGAERPLFEDPLLSDLHATPAGPVPGSATSVLEVPLDLSWPPPVPDGATRTEAGLVDLSWPSPAPLDAPARGTSKAAAGPAAPAADDTTAILEAQLDLTWPSPTPIAAPVERRTRTSHEADSASVTTASDARVDRGAIRSAAASDSQVAVTAADAPLPEVDVWPDVHQLDIPFELRLAPPTRTRAVPRLEAPFDLSSTTPIETPIVEPSRLVIPLDLSPTPPIPAVTPETADLERSLDVRAAPPRPTVATAPPAARPKRASRTEPSAPSTPVDVAAAAPVPSRPSVSPTTMTTPATAPAPALETPVDIAATPVDASPVPPQTIRRRTTAPVPAAAPAPSPPARRDRVAAPPRPVPATQASATPAHPAETSAAPTQAPTSAPATSQNTAPPSPAPRPARRTRPATQAAAPTTGPTPPLAAAIAKTPAPATLTDDAPKTIAPAKAPQPALARRSSTAPTRVQRTDPPPLVEASSDLVTTQVPSTRAARRKPAAAKPAPDLVQATATPVLAPTIATPAVATSPQPSPPPQADPVATQPMPPEIVPTQSGDGTHPVDAPGWPSLGEFAHPAGTADAISSSAASEPISTSPDDGFHPYRAVYERDAIRQDDGAAAQAIVEQRGREDAWERAASEIDAPQAVPVDTRERGRVVEHRSETPTSDAPIALPIAQGADQARRAEAEDSSSAATAASVGPDRKPAASEHDRLEARLETAERALRHLEERTNRQNGDLRNARRREIAEAVQHALEDGELTPHFDLLLGNGRLEFHRRGPGLSNNPGPIRRVAVEDVVDDLADRADASTAGPGPQITRERFVQPDLHEAER